MATEPQIMFIANLSSQLRELDTAGTETSLLLFPDTHGEQLAAMNWRQTSDHIDLMKRVIRDKRADAGADTQAARKAQDRTLPDVPAGRYALAHSDDPDDVTLYRIDRPTSGKWAGRVFVKTLANHRDGWGTRLFGADARDALDAIAADPLAAAALYGHTTHHCGLCGIVLSNPKSITAGIGPVCAKKL